MMMATGANTVKMASTVPASFQLDEEMMDETQGDKKWSVLLLEEEKGIL
jgi:hypothetical protein